MVNAKLLVEGKDDLHVLSALLKRYDFPEPFEIQETNGIDELMNLFPVMMKGSGLDRLGIVVDANSDIDKRWRQIEKHLKDRDYDNVPERPDENGTIVRYSGNDSDIAPIVGVWFMPNNQLPGMLEDFIHFLIPAGDRLFDYAKSCIDRLPEKRFKESYLSKSIIHTWLAWQEEPGSPMGSAITKRYLDSDCGQALTLKGWLQRLFVEEYPQVIFST